MDQIYNERKLELLKVKFNQKCKEVEELENINYSLQQKSKDDNKRLQLIIKRKNRILTRIQKFKLLKRERDITIEFLLKPRNNQ